MESRVSVVSAKGLDFDFVLAYGFGEAFVNDAAKLDADGDSAKMAVGYFMNKLYVAVTRPKEQLLVVDGQLGLDGLWKRYLSTDDLITAYRGKFGDEKLADMWKANIGTLLESNGNSSMSSEAGNDGTEGVGNPAAPLEIWDDCAGNDASTCLSSEFKYDPLGTARKYESGGMRERSPKLMRFAAKWFRRCKGIGRDDHRIDADRCEAFALLFDDKHKEAALLFAKIGDYKRACECWWNSCDYEHLANAPLSASEKYPFRFRFEFARAYSAGTLSAEVGVLKKIVENIDVENEDLSSEEWVRPVDDLVKKLFKGKILDENAAKVLCAAAGKHLYKVKPEYFVRLVDAKLYKQALELYETARFNPHEVEPENHRKARFYSEGIPGMLEFISEARTEDENRHIVEKYLGALRDDTRLIDDVGRRIVIDAFASTVGLADMWYELRQIRNEHQLTEIADRIGGKTARKALFQAAVIIRYEALRHGEAINSIANEGRELIEKFGQKFLVRLMARIAFAPGGGEQPQWNKIRPFIDESRVLDPSAYAFSDELPKEEFVVAFTKYENKLLSRFPQYRDSSRDSWRRVSYSWDTLRNDVLTRDKLSGESVYVHAPKESGVSNSPESKLAEMVKAPARAAEETEGRKVRGVAASSQVSPAQYVQANGGNKVVINFDGFKVKFFSRLKKVEFNISDGEDETSWGVDESGLEIDHAPYGFVEDKAIPGTNYSLSCDGVSADFQDGNGGHVTIRFN